VQISAARNTFFEKIKIFERACRGITVALRASTSISRSAVGVSGGL
jgi:hypothetical protein